MKETYHILTAVCQRSDRKDSQIKREREREKLCCCVVEACDENRLYGESQYSAILRKQRVPFWIAVHRRVPSRDLKTARPKKTNRFRNVLKHG